jgi:hypothetical protein
MDVHSICPVCPFYMGPLNMSIKYVQYISIYTEYLSVCIHVFSEDRASQTASRIPPVLIQVIGQVQEPPRHRIRS